MVNWWDFDWSGIEQKWTIYCIKLNSHACKRIKSEKLSLTISIFWHEFGNFSGTLEGILKNIFDLKILIQKMHRFTKKSMMKIFDRNNEFLNNERLSWKRTILNSCVFLKIGKRIKAGYFFKISFHFRWNIWWIFIFKNFCKKEMPLYLMKFSRSSGSRLSSCKKCRKKMRLLRFENGSRVAFTRI